jgi:lysophospholipase L1-like esterase
MQKNQISSFLPPNFSILSVSSFMVNEYTVIKDGKKREAFMAHYKKFGALAHLSLALLMIPSVDGTSDHCTKKKHGEKHWIGTWGTSPAETERSGFPGIAPDPKVFNNQTIRMIVHVSLGGKCFRVRLTNAYPSVINNTDPVQCLCPSNNQFATIGAAHIALRDSNAAIIPGTDRVLTFNGSTSVVIPPNAEVISDPIKLKVADESDLALSLYLPAGSEIYAARHPAAAQTSYIAPTTGNFTTNIDGAPFTEPTTQWFFVSGVEVLTKRDAIVTFGNSQTDGVSADLSTLDTNTRYPDFLVRRLIADENPFGIINAGISGNQVYYDSPWGTFGVNLPAAPFGPNALARFNVDALARAGVKYIILLEGINDIGFGVGLGLDAYPTTAQQIIDGYVQLIEKAHEKGIKIYGGTLLPFKNALAPLPYYTPAGEQIRQTVNEWIRTSGKFDAVIDFDKAVRDPADPLQLLPAYNSGDNLHPNSAGYQAMANAIDLNLFRDCSGKCCASKNPHINDTFEKSTKGTYQFLKGLEKKMHLIKKNAPK